MSNDERKLATMMSESVSVSAVARVAAVIKAVEMNLPNVAKGNGF